MAIALIGVVDRLAPRVSRAGRRERHLPRRAGRGVPRSRSLSAAARSAGVGEAESPALFEMTGA